MEIGQRIKELRKNKGWSQTFLAEKLNTTQDTISLWELGKSFPDVISLIKLVEIFDVSSDYLLGLKEI